MKSYTPIEAATFLNVSKSWLAKLRVSGGGPRYVKLGKAVRYREDELLSWQSEHVRASTTA